MTNRLRLSLSPTNPIFKLSKPGINVDAAGEADLLFDMSTGVYSGILMSGTVPQSSFTVSNAANFYGFTNYLAFDIPYGKTFSTLPKVSISINDPILGAGYFGPQYNPNDTAFDNVGGSGFSGNTVFVGGDVSLSKLRLIMYRVYFSGSPYPYPANVSYVVYHG